MEWMGIAVGLVVMVLLLYLLIENRLKAARDDLGRRVGEGVEQMRSGLEDVRLSMANELRGVRQEVGKQLSDATGNLVQVSGQVRDQLQKQERAFGELFQVAERIREVGKDISSLQEILQAPKARGGLGELFLENLLSEILPSSHYELQREFSNSSKVDAVIRLGERLVPIDAKFPLENFKTAVSAQDQRQRDSARRAFIRDVKNHIDDIANKYIRPADGTYEFAFMYIPAENVYYEVVTKPAGAQEQEDLQTYALKKHVIPVSPNSLYAYLCVIVFGLRGMQIEENAQRILETLSQIRGDFGQFGDDFRTLGRHIQNAWGKFGEADSKLGRLQARILSIGQPSLEDTEGTAALPTDDNPLPSQG